MSSNEVYTVNTKWIAIGTGTLDTLYYRKYNVILYPSSGKHSIGQKYYFDTESDMLLFKLKYSEYLTDLPEYKI